MQNSTVSWLEKKTSEVGQGHVHLLRSLGEENTVLGGDTEGGQNMEPGRSVRVKLVVEATKGQ